MNSNDIADLLADSHGYSMMPSVPVDPTTIMLFQRLSQLWDMPYKAAVRQALAKMTAQTTQQLVQLGLWEWPDPHDFTGILPYDGRFS
jgi:hypothetical protein